jgi:hypothetical protein
MMQMAVTLSDSLLLAHAAFGVAGCLAALWAFVETLNATASNASRIRAASLLTALCMAAAWICGGYFYVHFYPAEKAILLKGPWPFAHNIFMETKEHLFFVTSILALLLPVVARENLNGNAVARRLALTVASLVLITGLAVEGAGAVIAHGVKVALRQSAMGGRAQ